MIKSQPWTWSNLQMMLGYFMTLVGRNFIMQRRLFWLEKKILIPCWIKVVLVLILKWKDSHWTNSLGIKVNIEGLENYETKLKDLDIVWLMKEFNKKFTGAETEAN